MIRAARYVLQHQGHMRKIIVACDFSEDVLGGVERGEKYQQDALILRTMRQAYEFFDQQLGILGKEEAEVLDSSSKEKRIFQQLQRTKGLYTNLHNREY